MAKLDDIQQALIKFFKNNTDEEWLTLREIASEVGVKHPQTVLNKLNQLVSKWFFVKDTKWYRLIKTSEDSSISDIMHIPVYGFAQCGHHGQAVVEEYSQEKIPGTTALLGVKNLDSCFFVRAKWNSMEPKIQDADLVLIKQQDHYDPHDYVFVVHNNHPKLKKILEKEGKYYLESVNRFFTKKEVKPYDLTKVIWVVKKIIKSI